MGSTLITAPNGRKCLLKKVTENNGEFVDLFTYDEKDRIVKDELYKEGVYYQTIFYEYKETFVLATLSGDITDSSFIYYKNNRVDSMILKSSIAWNDEFRITTSIDTYTYKYDTNGKLTEENWLSEERDAPPYPGKFPSTLTTRLVLGYNNGDIIDLHSFGLDHSEEFYSTYDFQCRWVSNPGDTGVQGKQQRRHFHPYL